MGGSFGFLKGHGTENDFVLLPDPDGRVHGAALDPGLVARLCERHSGIGADGVIRVVRCDASADPVAVAARGRAEWFMDYRNADGSVAEMCGNGVRVLARYLAEHAGVDTGGPLHVATRAGLTTLTFDDDGWVSADMGSVAVYGETKVGLGSRSWPATHVSMGNPHAVAFVEDLVDVGSLRDGPTYDTTLFPHGVNVELVARRGERHVAMRVSERGSGETRSCGTGACAAMVAAASAAGMAGTHPGTDLRYRVDVPGGELAVTWTAHGHVLLAGPAVIVAEGHWVGGSV